jgi:hypothetical protein
MFLAMICAKRFICTSPDFISGYGIKYEIARIYELMEILSGVSLSIIDPWMPYLSKNAWTSSSRE